MKRLLIAATFTLYAGAGLATEPVKCSAFVKEMMAAAAAEQYADIPGRLGAYAKLLNEGIAQGKLNREDASRVFYGAAGGYCLAVLDLTQEDKPAPKSGKPTMRSM